MCESPCDQKASLGAQYRVKYASSGTYAGGTTLEVDIAGDLLPAK